MARAQTQQSQEAKPLRLWPGVLIVVLQWLARFGLPVVVPSAGPIGAMAALAGGPLIIIWWFFFSRAPRLDRWLALLLMVLGLYLTPHFLHESVATGGMGMIYYIYAIPVVCLALVAWAMLSRWLPDLPRRLALVLVVFLSCGVWTLLRTDGISGLGSDFAWRWSATAEQQLLASGEDLGAGSRLSPAVLGTEAQWPGFRGPQRDGAVPGLRIQSDWDNHPPQEIWRRPVGPGWSSFAVQGDLFYTQEQRGDQEVVSCYRVASGEPVWRHGDTARFWESNAGAGPRGTPTLQDGRVYALGATGILNALDASDGSRLWHGDLASDSGLEVPHWGFSSSPLVVGDLALAAAAGMLLAYDRESGELRWSGENGGTGYSSPQLFTLGGVDQVVFLHGDGATSYAPANGQVLWEHEWSGYPIVQPAQVDDTGILISVSEQDGTRRLELSRGSGAWSVQEGWTSTGLKPYFNDFVVHEGHAYGFDGRILASIDLEDGKRRWKGGRYGNGQMVLLPAQDLMLILSEQGELALVAATPDSYTELARHPALEGKTWNHPVLVDDILLVRNDREMVAFRLARAD